ncbi:uncharacterized protein LOC143433104 [Xylocopa sonorina]|uniref:uncharacterized protein LOC143433104 n=1 Tax=Xylocopa sonorina TaxID=1818115 RepID=UPI00403A8138
MTTLKGIFPDTKPVKGKNFIYENVRNLRRIEQYRMIKKIEETQNSQIYGRKKKIGNSNRNNCNYTQNILSKLNSSFQIKKDNDIDTDPNVNCKIDEHQGLCKKCSTPVLNKNNLCTKKTLYTTNNSLTTGRKKEYKEFHTSTQELHEKVSSDPNLLYHSIEDNDTAKITIKVKNQGIQTLNAEEIDNLYSEGTIKYSSKKNLNIDEPIDKNKTHEKIGEFPKNVANSPSDRGDTQLLEKNAQNKNKRNPRTLPPKEETNFIKLNKDHTSMTNKITTQHNNNYDSVLPTNYRIGVIPKYIKNRKEIQEKIQKAKVEELDPNCPKGHVPLPDCERKETLQMLKKNYQDYVNELNMMPIKIDTLRAQRRKIEIEKQLNKLEEGIKVFSRPKVYVKMNA